ncbi:conserved hypothetical protein (plasmid) [Borreliella garinii PBr]|uniref:Uncharacterized protein n=1 Tax=Borreliella garinii PBr TaxID=498743 RepID=B8F185_BORGR|nr:conserved hypothetical protein [Borreliella garinii PBr]
MLGNAIEFRGKNLIFSNSDGVYTNSKTKKITLLKGTHISVE